MACVGRLFGAGLTWQVGDVKDAVTLTSTARQCIDLSGRGCCGLSMASRLDVCREVMASVSVAAPRSLHAQTVSLSLDKWIT